MADVLSDLGRFSDPSLFVLISLAAEPRHGYAMLADIEALGGPRLGPGTLYGALARLEERGLIVACAVEGRRRPYRITDIGAQALRARLRELDRIAGSGLARLAAS